VLNKLGEGAFGQVFKVKRKIDSQIYAMKKVIPFSISDQTSRHETKVKRKRIKLS